MTAKDVFGLFIRMLGYLLTVYGFYDLVFSFAETIGIISEAKYPAIVHFYFRIFYIVMGWVIIWEADSVANFAYRTKKSKTNQT